MPLRPIFPQFLPLLAVCAYASATGLGSVGSVSAEWIDLSSDGAIVREVKAELEVPLD